jgi:hypothetical protein
VFHQIYERQKERVQYFAYGRLGYLVQSLVTLPIQFSGAAAGDRIEQAALAWIMMRNEADADASLFSHVALRNRFEAMGAEQLLGGVEDSGPHPFPFG